MKDWARSLKADVIALWLIARHPETPLAARIVAGAIAAYALSPIDLIPDFIPVLGLLDDLLIVPAGIWLALRLVPQPLLAECRDEARRRALRPTSPVAAAAIIALWLALAFLAWRALA